MIPSYEIPRQQANVVLLGTGTPNAEPHHSGPSVAIIVNEIPYLVDCGPGVVRRAMEAYQKGTPGLNPINLQKVFLTHLHSDHTTGLPDLILTPWVLGRDVPLELIGPFGTQGMVDHILLAYQKDIQFRIDGLEHANSTGWKVNTHEIGSFSDREDQSENVFSDQNVMVEAIPVQHGNWQAFAFTFSTPEMKIVISGDTTPSELLVEKSYGCDILVHEVYSRLGFNRHTPDWQRYHQNMHTSTMQLAKMANRIRPGLLVLYHQLYWGESDASLIKEILEHYDGEVVSGQDLDVF